MQSMPSLKPSVLVVDDDSLSRSIVARRLKSLADVVEAGGGIEAIAVLHARDIHLVVVDLDMPGMNGFDVIRHMRTQPALRCIPIIVLSANEIDGLQRSLAAGVTSALRKPLDWRAFGEHVRHVLELAFRAGHMALRDGLTGLANRALFEDRLHQAIRQSGPHAPVAVHLLDLDRFKQINDEFGHAAGDELLVEVARRLSHVAIESLCVARLGGDEFAILQPLPSSQCAEAAMSLAHRIIDDVSTPYDLRQGRSHIGVSIGTDVAASPSCTYEILLRNADAALYAAKRAGRGTACLHRAS